MLNIFTEAVKADIFRKGAEITRRGTAELEEAVRSVRLREDHVVAHDHRL